MNKTAKITILAVLSVLAISASILALLFWNGEILINNPNYEEYPVRGVDVSAYQGEIDW